jgi:uncharacterized protein YjiS (DUF1127 family)
MNALTHDIRSAAATAKAVSAPPVQESATFFGAALHALASWWRARRDATRLSGYPDRMLKDIGMARGGIEWAVRHGRDEDAEDRPAKDPIYTDKWSIQNEVHP